MKSNQRGVPQSCPMDLCFFILHMNGLLNSSKLFHVYSLMVQISFSLTSPWMFSLSLLKRNRNQLLTKFQANRLSLNLHKAILYYSSHIKVISNQTLQIYIEATNGTNCFL